MKQQEGANAHLVLREAFTCPLSGAIMEDPVIVAGSCDGRSYERSAIEARFARGDFSDPSDENHDGALIMTDLRIVTNTALRKFIQSMLASSSSSYSQ